MPKNTFPLPSDFEPPEGYLLQRTVDNQLWVFSTSGQKLSAKKVRGFINAQRLELQRMLKPKRSSVVDPREENNAQLAASTLALQNFLQQVSTSRIAISDSRSRSSQFLSEKLAAITEDPDANLPFGEECRMASFTKNIGPSFMRLIDKYHEALLRHLDSLERQVEGKEQQERQIMLDQFLPFTEAYQIFCTILIPLTNSYCHLSVIAWSDIIRGSLWKHDLNLKLCIHVYGVCGER